MNKTFIENRLKNALKRLYYFDYEIISNNSHERSITHRLAIHLGEVFYEGWDIDVEYNRNLGDMKKIDVINKLVKRLKSKIDNNEDIISGRRSVYPDIIVHRRNSADNLLVVEVKKMNVSEQLEQYDIDKLKAYITEETLKYQYAAFIKIGDLENNPKYDYKVISRGEWLTQGELDFG